MPQGIVRVLPLRDFTGGLNLRDDAFQLATNESSDMLNVEISPAGGIMRRKTVRTYNAVALPTVPAALMDYPSHNQVVVQLGNVIGWSAGGGTVTVLPGAAPLDCTVDGRMRSATGGRLTGATRNVESLYIARGPSCTVVRWSGTGSTVSEMLDASAGFNEQIDVPAGGRFPQCRYLVATGGFMFAGSTREAGVDYRSRVRWSHPGEHEDWRRLDYVDVDPNDGGEITAIVPWRDSVLIFKDRSIFRLSGYSAETFTVEKISSTVGAVSAEAVSVSDYGVAFFDRVRGMHLFDGQVRWLWGKLSPMLDDGRVLFGYRDGVQVCWSGPRLYCSVPFESGVVNGRTFVADVRVGLEAWVPWGVGFNGFVSWRPSGADAMMLGCSVDRRFLLELEVGTGLDDLGTGDVGFESYFMTAWFDAGAPGVKKRFRRPHLILGNDVSYPLQITAYKDYDMNRAPNQGTVFVRGASDVTIPITVESGGEYDEDLPYDEDGQYDEGTAGSIVDALPLVWGSGYWGASFWGGFLFGGDVIKRGPTLGRAMAVRLRLSGDTSVDWRLDSLQIPYVMGRVK